LNNSLQILTAVACFTALFLACQKPEPPELDFTVMPDSTFYFDSLAKLDTCAYYNQNPAACSWNFRKGKWLAKYPPNFKLWTPRETDSLWFVTPDTFGMYRESINGWKFFPSWWEWDNLKYTIPGAPQLGTATRWTQYDPCTKMLHLWWGSWPDGPAPVPYAKVTNQ